MATAPATVVDLAQRALRQRKGFREEDEDYLREAHAEKAVVEKGAGLHKKIKGWLDRNATVRPVRGCYALLTLGQGFSSLLSAPCNFGRGR